MVYAATKQWVMVVSLAVQKKLQFYGSKDLKAWTHLSDFGPAGVADKPNWECPDLFELPAVGEPGVTRWVLKADMGSGAVAGGSGGEYFLGDVPVSGNKFYEVKYFDPNGVMIDLTDKGWAGAIKDAVAADDTVVPGLRDPNLNAARV